MTDESRRSRRRVPAFVLALAALIVGPGARTFAQTPEVAPHLVDGLIVSGSVRTRVESWDWFGDNPGGSYTYPASLIRIGVGRSTQKFDWQIEASAPLLFSLPEQPIGAGPAGLGANYFIANDRSRNAAGLFVKQAFFTVKNLGGVLGQSLKAGRMEFLDGAEVSPKNRTLAALKRDRVAARLLANFGFTHVQRSFDGVQYALDRPAMNLTTFAARPTSGVFQVDGWGELSINVLYGALTHQVSGRKSVGEWRLFGLDYLDHRDDATKTDNRALAVRQADRTHIAIGTFGGHYVGALTGERATFDALFWGAIQIGSWGDLRHRAGAFAAEAGWQPKIALGPWIRGGFDYASGDHDAADGTHGTFFQVLPTPRLYARFPFFNLMNTADAFGELILRPSKWPAVRLDVHSLQVADGNDLWYQGGGAFQQTTFGYIGQATGGHRGLATLYDASADLALSTRLSVTGYYGFAVGGPAAGAIYATRNQASLGYAEVLVRF